MQSREKCKGTKELNDGLNSKTTNRVIQKALYTGQEYTAQPDKLY